MAVMILSESVEAL